MLIEKIVVGSIGTILLGGLTACYYQSAKLENFKNVFLNAMLLIEMLCTVTFPICMIFC